MWYFVVVIVVMTSLSDNANTWGQMPQRGKEFHSVITVDESGVSVFPLWYLTVIFLNQWHHLSAAIIAHNWQIADR